MSDVARAYGELHRAACERWEARVGAPVVISVGTATCGRSAGALEVLGAIRAEVRELGLDFEVVEVGCLGHCYAEPLVAVSVAGRDVQVFSEVDTISARLLVRELARGEERHDAAFAGVLDACGRLVAPELAARNALERRLITRRCGIVDPCDIDSSVAHGAYSALARALQGTGEATISEIEASGLRGRGGAGFPTGCKWRLCRDAGLEAGRAPVVICNGDEGDPGSFVDRVLMESDPHAVIEGMCIAGYAVRASVGYLYVRAEYPLAAERMELAVQQARSRGILGSSVLGSGFAFDVQVFKAAGAFVCGEETALIASMEGHRAQPRLKPPYPAQRGLEGAPTLVDNVKTLACAGPIVERGAEWFSCTGTPASPGTALFALAGKTARSGLAEVPMGTTLRQLVFDVGGGMVDPNKVKPGYERADTGNGGYLQVPDLPPYRFKAVQIGGPSGGCLPEGLLDVAVDFDSLAEHGAMMGSGGLVVLAHDDCMVEMARYFLEFTQRESCGACSYCRLGCKAMLSLLEGFVRGEGSEGDMVRLATLARNVRAGSRCNLGKTAPNPVLTTLRYFEDEYRAHFERHECPSLVCKELVSYEFDDIGCFSKCEECCIVCDAITCETGWDWVYDRQVRTHVIDDEACVRCAVCASSCAGTNYRAIKKVTPAKTGRWAKP